MLKPSIVAFVELLIARFEQNHSKRNQNVCTAQTGEVTYALFVLQAFYFQHSWTSSLRVNYLIHDRVVGCLRVLCTYHLNPDLKRPMTSSFFAFEQFHEAGSLESICKRRKGNK